MELLAFRIHFVAKVKNIFNCSQIKIKKCVKSAKKLVFKNILGKFVVQNVI